MEEQSNFWRLFGVVGDGLRGFLCQDLSKRILKVTRENITRVWTESQASIDIPVGA